MATAWKVVLGVACLGVCSNARGDVVRLAELEARVLEQRPELRAGQARIRQAEAELAGARSAYWPTVAADVDATLGPRRTLVRIPFDGGEYLVAGTQKVHEPRAFIPQPRYGAAIAARGNIYDFGRTAAAEAAARANQRASQADARAQAELLLLELRAAYLRWTVAHALHAIAEHASEAARAGTERVAGLIAEGAAATAAQTPAAARANAAAAEAERALLELETARLELEFLSRTDLGSGALPDPALLEPSPPSAAESAPAGAASTAAVEALERARDAAEARRRAQARADAPVFGYRVHAGIEGQDDDVFPNFGVGVGFSVPLWDGGASAAGEAGARAAAAELAARAEAKRAEHTHRAARRKLQAQHAARLAELAAEALALAEARVRQLQTGQSLGAAERDAIAQAESERARAQAELVRARAALAETRLGL